MRPPRHVQPEPRISATTLEKLARLSEELHPTLQRVAEEMARAADNKRQGRERGRT